MLDLLEWEALMGWYHVLTSDDASTASTISDDTIGIHAEGRGRQTVITNADLTIT